MGKRFLVYPFTMNGPKEVDAFPCSTDTWTTYGNTWCHIGTSAKWYDNRADAVAAQNRYRAAKIAALSKEIHDWLSLEPLAP